MEDNEIQVPALAEKPAQFRCKAFKAAARKELHGKWKPMILITLFIAAITLCISLVFMFFNSTNLLRFQNIADPGEIALRMWGTMLIMMLIYSIIFPAISLAYIMLFPVNKNGIKPSLSHFFSGFSYWYKGLGSFWWLFLWLFLWILAGAVPGLILTIILTIANIGNSAYLTTYLTTGLLVLYFGMFTTAIIKEYQYSQQFFIIADNPAVKVTKALNISKKITKGFKWKLFVLDLSFIGWFFLLYAILWVGFRITGIKTAVNAGWFIAILTAIFFIFFLPYYMASKFNAFKWLMKRNEEKQSVLIEQKPGV